jgi:hypothetical protein
MSGAAALVVALVLASGDPVRSLYVIDGQGREHFLGPVTSQKICEAAIKGAQNHWPFGIDQDIGPPPWRFECRPENRFKSGWDRING